MTTTQSNPALALCSTCKEVFEVDDLNTCAACDGYTCIHCAPTCCLHQVMESDLYRMEAE